MTQKEDSLFIVDNSISGWTGLKYLEQWTEISKSFDIATGYFEIGALLALDGYWQKLEKIRVLMGSETTLNTKQVLMAAVKEKAEKIIEEDLEHLKDKNPFLNGVNAIIEAIKSGQIECRVYKKSKFHAKTFITHPKLEIVGSKALVGSSNFTKPGLKQNIELNVQVQSPSEVEQLQKWYEKHWEYSEDISEEVLEVIGRHMKIWSPFDVYSHALRELFRDQEESANIWEEQSSIMFSKLDQYQKEAYWSLLKITKRFGGAFLCDGVGLGKTFVGLMLIERMIYEKKHVVLFAPKGARMGVWEPKLKELLPDLSGKDFSNLAVFSHTDLNRKNDYPERFNRIAEVADVVIVDEAHHFRNKGTEGETDTEEGRSRYYRLMDLMHTGNRKKQLFMLTATPINNKLIDLRNMIELFTNEDQEYFSRLGIHNLRNHFNKLERDLRKNLLDISTNIGENITAINTFLEKDEIFENLIVQRSRKYAIESQIKEYGKSAAFPERKKPEVAEYSIFKTYGKLLDLIKQAFERSSPLFSLVVYNPFKYYLGDPNDIDELKKGRSDNVVTLIRTQFLKRFESSVSAFETSCDRLMKKLLAFLEKHCETDDERNLYDIWIRENQDILNYIAEKQSNLFETDEDEDNSELFPEELLARWDLLERDKYDVTKIIKHTFDDLDELVKLLKETRKFKSENDDKLNKLKRMLKSKKFIGKKVIIFTEFADTARYLMKELQIDDVEGLAKIDGSSSEDRFDIIQRFSPYYNSSSSLRLKEEEKKEIRVLIATDVLSEGLNLQDSTLLVNYDIHWNPVRLMQRIGRIDRRMDQKIEEKILNDHPNLKSDRGKITFYNFLPPKELNILLSLYNIVTRKTLMISETMGIEGRKLLTPEDDYEALKEFNAGYEGKKSLIESLQLDLQELLKNTPNLKERLDAFPSSIFSGKTVPKEGTTGIFFCYRLPVWDSNINDYTIENGPCNWYLYDMKNGNILEDHSKIITTVQCLPEEPRKCINKQELLIEIREKVRKHIKDGYLKKVDAPVGVKPKLLAWMEII